MMINYPTLTEKKRNFILLAIFVLSLTVKVAIFYFATDPIIFNKYPYFAEQISKGALIGERILDLSPAYLCIAVLFFKVWGSNWEALALLQILLGSINCLLIYFIGSRIFGAAAGLLAAVLLMLYGNMTLVELTLEPEAFVLFFNSLALLALLAAGNESNTTYRSWKWLLAGMLIGLSAVTKPNALLIIPGALIWVWFWVKTWENRTRAAASLLLGACLLIAPVTIRNYVQFHDFILVTADSGKVFFHGNGPGATGMERADLPDQGIIEDLHPAEPDYAHALFRQTARALSKAPLKPSECSGFWFNYTIKQIQADPLAALFLEWKKFCLFWNNYEVHDLDSTYQNYARIREWPLIPYGVISALGILGMGIARSRFRYAFLLYWMIFVYLFSVLVFFAASRYRIPAVPFLCLFAAQCLVHLYNTYRQKNFKIAAWLIPILFLLTWTYLPFHKEIGQFDRWQQASRIHYSLMGKPLFAKGEYQEAISEFEKVIATDPTFVPAYDYLGKSYAILGNLDKAQSCFEKMISLAPTIDEGYLNMGLLLELKGQPSKALPYFDKALSLNPNNKKAKERKEKLLTYSPPLVRQ